MAGVTSIEPDPDDPDTDEESYIRDGAVVVPDAASSPMPTSEIISPTSVINQCTVAEDAEASV